MVATDSFLKIGLNLYGLYQNCSGLKSKDVNLFYAVRNVFKMMPNKVGSVSSIYMELTGWALRLI